MSYAKLAELERDGALVGDEWILVSQELEQRRMLRDISVWPPMRAEEAGLVGLNGVLGIFRIVAPLGAIGSLGQVVSALGEGHSVLAVSSLLAAVAIGYGSYLVEERIPYAIQYWRALLSVLIALLVFGLLAEDLAVGYASRSSTKPVAALMWAIVWLIYWCNSRRVALTFAPKKSESHREGIRRLNFPRLPWRALSDDARSERGTPDRASAGQGDVSRVPVGVPLADGRAGVTTGRNRTRHLAVGFLVGVVFVLGVVVVGVLLAQSIVKPSSGGAGGQAVARVSRPSDPRDPYGLLGPDSAPAPRSGGHDSSMTSPLCSAALAAGDEFKPVFSEHEGERFLDSPAQWIAPGLQFYMEKVRGAGETKWTYSIAITYHGSEEFHLRRKESLGIVVGDRETVFNASYTTRDTDGPGRVRIMGLWDLPRETIDAMGGSPSVGVLLRGNESLSYELGANATCALRRFASESRAFE